ncbi:MAG: cytidylyltransferase domain-containing protein, partial [Gelidibacter sp.]
MKITALIPARKNSQRFPGKNFAPFLGKPLFRHSVDFAKDSDLIMDYFVTTN